MVTGHRCRHTSELQFVHHGHDLIACVIIIITVTVAVGVLWSAVREIVWRRGPTARVSCELDLGQVDALDGRRQHVLLGAQFASGLFQRGHLGLDRVDGVEPAFHGPEVVVHGC
jgi:hypothetical protein